MYNLMPQQNTNISLYQESQAKDNCGFGLIVNRHGIQNQRCGETFHCWFNQHDAQGAIGAMVKPAMVAGFYLI